MARQKSRLRLVPVFAVLLALALLLTAFAAVLHDDHACTHEHCPLCDLLHHRNAALQSQAAAAMALFGATGISLCLGIRKKTVLFTPVYLKDRMNR